MDTCKQNLIVFVKYIEYVIYKFLEDRQSGTR